LRTVFLHTFFTGSSLCAAYSNKVYRHGLFFWLIRIRGKKNLANYFVILIYQSKKSRLWIRIHLIRIQIQHFRLNTDPDPGFWWPKIEKNLELKKKYFFFKSKTTIYLSLGLHLVTAEAFSSQKRTSSTSKHEIS
jgi:hypothetical protein